MLNEKRRKKENPSIVTHAVIQSEDDMAGFFMFQRGKTWHFRRRIPAELKKYFPPKTIFFQRALLTDDKKVAKVNASVWVAKTEQVFALLRTDLPDSVKAEVIKSQLLPDFAPKDALKLSDLVKQYLESKAQSWKAKSSQEIEWSLNLAVRIIGDLPLRHLEHSHIVKYAETLLQLPPNFSRLKKYRDLSIKEILALPATAKEQIHDNSVNKHIDHFKTMNAFAVTHQLMSYDIVGDFKVRTQNVRSAQEERQIYDLDDLQNIVHHLHLDLKKPSHFFVPLIAIFSGMRRGEICQLYLKDIVHTGAYWGEDIDFKEEIVVFDVNDYDGEMKPYKEKGEEKLQSDKKVKNKNARRLVPIHPFLWNDLGFAGYVAFCKQNGQKRLFEDLKFHRDGYGTSFSKWYDYNIGKKIAPKGSGKAFHSIRHSFIDWFKQIQLPNLERGMAIEILKEVVGHSLSDSKGEEMTRERYGKKYPPKTLASLVYQLDYGLDFYNVLEQTGGLVEFAGKQRQIKLNPNLEMPMEGPER